MKIKIPVFTLLFIVFSVHQSFANRLSPQAQFQSEVALQVIEANLKLDSKVEQMQTQQIEDRVENGRIFRKATLHHSGVETTQILISAPADFETSGKRYPIVFVSAGFYSGMDSIKLFQHRADVVYVGYQYPTTIELIKQDPSLLPKSIRLVPGQLALIMEWLNQQSWSRTNHLHIVGVSLGTLFFPVSLKLAERRGIVVRSTSLLYGGAHPRPVFENALKDQLPADVLEGVLQVSDVITAPFDPRIYLPLLRGPFLTIYGTQDEVFPKSTSLQQYVLLPEPKQIHYVEGPHIDVNQPGVIKQAVDILERFLDDQL